MTLTVCCFKWRPRVGYRSTFGPETVNTLARMVARHYPHEHRFVAFTDDGTGIDRRLVEVIPLWKDHGLVYSPYGSRRPSCYRRLKLFDPAMREVVGERVVWLDLDCVITGDLTPLWDRPEDIVLWGGTNQKTPYNGSMVLMTVGARPKVWTSFNPHHSPRVARAAGFYGSDQAWLSYILGGKEARWTQADGVYSFQRDIVPLGYDAPLPENCRITLWHGVTDPWSQAGQRLAWVRQHYR